MLTAAHSIPGNGYRESMMLPDLGSRMEWDCHPAHERVLASGNQDITAKLC